LSSLSEEVFRNQTKLYKRVNQCLGYCESFGRNNYIRGGGELDSQSGTMRNQNLDHWISSFKIQKFNSALLSIQYWRKIYEEVWALFYYIY
jgi:hypothetical protein